MAAELHITPARATDANGLVISGAKWFFYETGTTTPLSVYTTAALSVAHSNPVVADSGGKFANVYLDVSQTYRAVLKSADEATTIYDIDPVNNDTLSQISAGSGSSLIGFQQAGSGAGVRSVQAKLRDFVHLDDYYLDTTPGTEAADSAALKAAITYATTNWTPIILPARRIYWDGTAITADKVMLIGSGVPEANAGKTALTGGTIIEGQMILTGSYIHLENFGVDLGSSGGADDVDAIKCTAATYNTGKYLYTYNLIGLCKNITTANHVLLFEGYQRHFGGNLKGVLGYFGCVIKNQNVSLDGLYMDGNAEVGVYGKSDPDYGTIDSIKLSNIFLTGGQDTGVLVQAEDAAVDDIQITGVTGTGHERTVMVQLLDNAGSEVKNVVINNVYSNASTIADVSVLSQRSGKFVDNVTVDTVIAIDGTAKGIETSNEPGAATRFLKVRNFYKSYPSGTLQATMDDGIFIDGGVQSSDIEGVEIVENYGTGSKIGSINYQNLTYNRANILGSHRCMVKGSGRPLVGNLNQTLSGATATLQIPENLSGNGISFANITIAANATITTFTPEWTNQIFPPGHVLYVYNNSAFVLSVGHNVPQGILNQGGVTINLAANEVGSWVHVGGGVWVQQKIS